MKTVTKSSRFSDRMYALLKKVPKGKVTTYKDLAHALGTGAYRGVGQALRRNPNAPMVPCHRVVASNGSIGGYSGEREGGAIQRKIELLKKEDVMVKDNKVVDFEQKRFRFPLIISHRALGFGHPENTLKAVREALFSRVECIELDLRLTKDHKWVVIHNPFLKNEERRVMRVHAYTLSRLRQEVLTLETVLALVAAEGTKLLMLDIKDVGEEKQILKLLEHYGLENRTVLISWEPEVLKRIHARNPSVRLGFSYVPIASSLRYVKGSLHKSLTKYGVLMSFNALHSFDAKHKIGKSYHHFLSDLPDLPLYSIQVPAVFCSNELVKRAHAKKLKVFPFGVNSRLTFMLLKRRSVDGVLTNKPKLFLE